MSKIRITFKSPDGVSDSIRDAVKEIIDPQRQFLDKDELSDIKDDTQERIHERVSKWIKYGEYVTIEIDLDTDTARVLEA